MKGERRGERGQALVELALVLPVLALLLFAIIDFGLALNARIQVANAVREGARLGAVIWPAPDVEIKVRDRVLSRTGLVINANVGPIEVSFPQGRFTGGSVMVKAECSYRFMFPFLADLASMGCGSSAVMRLE